MPKISEVYVFIATDAGPDDEGIPAAELVLDGRPVMFPLMGANVGRVESIRQLVLEIATKGGRRITLARFTHREDVEVLEPQQKK